jgi:hypothetical protein
VADKTNSSRTTPRPYRSRHGTYQFKTFEESTCVSTATIRYGDVVQFDVNSGTAAHRIVKSSTMANVPNVLSSAFLGIAMDTSTSDGSTTGLLSSAVGQFNANSKVLNVCLATPGTEFWFPTKSSVVTSTCLGTRRAIAYDSTLSMFYVDIGNSTAGDATVIITDIPEPGNDANNPVIVKFLSTATARLISQAF